MSEESVDTQLDALEEGVDAGQRGLSRRSVLRGAGIAAAAAGAGLVGTTLLPEAAGASVIATDLQDATGTVNVSSATAPTSGQVLTATSSTAATWQPNHPKIIQLQMPSTNTVNGNTPTNVNAGYATSAVITGNQQVGVEFWSGSFSVPAGYTSALLTAEVSGSVFGKGYGVINLLCGQPTGGLPLTNIYQSAPKTGVTEQTLGVGASGTSGTLWTGSMLVGGLTSGTAYFSFQYGIDSLFAGSSIPGTGAQPNFPASSGVAGLCLLNPDFFGVQRTAYVTAYSTGKLYPVTLNPFYSQDSVQYASNGTAGTAITVGAGPVGLAVTNDTSGSGSSQYFLNTYVLCTNFLGSSVSVIATATNTVYKTINHANNANFSATADPYDVVVAPNNSIAYVSDYANAVVYPITSIGSGGTFTVGAGVAVGTNPEGMCFTQDSKHLYVANKGSNNVTVINTSTQAIVRTVTMTGDAPVALASTPNPPTTGNPASSTDFNIWVACSGANKAVPILDSTGALGTGVSFSATAITPSQIAITPDGLTLVVMSSSGSNTFVQSVIQGPGSPAVADYGGSAPWGGIAISTDGTYYYTDSTDNILASNPGANFICIPNNGAFGVANQYVNLTVQFV